MPPPSTRGHPQPLMTPMRDKSKRGQWAAGDGAAQPDEGSSGLLQKLSDVVSWGLNKVLSPKADDDVQADMEERTSRPIPGTDPRPQRLSARLASVRAKRLAMQQQRQQAAADGKQSAAAAAHAIEAETAQVQTGKPASLMNLVSEAFVGINCKGDATRFQKDFDIKIATDEDSMLDLMAKFKETVGPFDNSRPRSNWSMERLCAHFINVNVNKEIRLSDWETTSLTRHQIEYASMDVLLTAHVFRVFISLRSQFRYLHKDRTDWDRQFSWNFKSKDVIHMNQADNASNDRKQYARMGTRVYFAEENGSESYVRTGVLIAKGSHHVAKIEPEGTNGKLFILVLDDTQPTLEGSHDYRWINASTVSTDWHVFPTQCPDFCTRAVCVVHTVRWLRKVRQLFTNFSEAKIKLMQDDESILKNLPNPKVESLLVDLMLQRWAKHPTYKEPHVAKAFRDSWYHSGFRLMRLALSSFGGLPNDNNGLEAFNNVQKDEQNFERYGITQFCPK